MEHVPGNWKINTKSLVGKMFGGTNWGNRCVGSENNIKMDLKWNVKAKEDWISLYVGNLLNNSEFITDGTLLDILTPWNSALLRRVSLWSYTFGHTGLMYYSNPTSNALLFVWQGWWTSWFSSYSNSVCNPGVNPMGKRTASPPTPPSDIRKRKCHKHRFCRQGDMKSFTFFILKPKSAPKSADTSALEIWKIM